MRKITHKDKMLVAQLDELRNKLIIALFVIGVLALSILWMSFKDTVNSQDNIQVSTKLGATYYTPSGIYVRFDSTDANQVRLVQQIEMICKVNNFVNCMNAKDRLGGGQ